MSKVLLLVLLSGFYRDKETETLPMVTQTVNGRARVYLSPGSLTVESMFLTIYCLSFLKKKLKMKLYKKIESDLKSG